MALQQGDVKLFQTDDDGNVSVVDGVMEMSGGLETAAYLSLFGGNDDDDGRDGNPLEWWGNIGENIQARKYRSETQNLIQGLPATTGNLQRIEDAAKRDLAWFLSVGAASSVAVGATIHGLIRVKITVTIEANGEESTFSFTENWKANI